MTSILGKSSFYTSQQDKPTSTKRVIMNIKKLQNVARKKLLLIKTKYHHNTVYIKSEDFVFDKNAFDKKKLEKYLSLS